MGCAICLDDFDQADGDTKRATSLVCGHIFHYDCLQTWFFGPAAAQTHRPNQKRCPLCSALTNPESMVRLYPSDGNDLDTYLSGQQVWDMQVFGLDGAKRGEEDLRGHKQLLNDLMDFNKAIQSYVLATHSAHVENIVKTGVKVRKLVLDLTKDRGPDLEDSLRSAMDALENGAASFSTLYNDLSRRVRKNKQMETNLARQKEQVDALNTQADRKYKQAEEKLHEAQRLEAELRESRKDAEAMQRRLQERIEQVQQSERTLLAKEKSFQSEQRKMTLQTNLTLSNMKSTTEAQLASMREKMEEALIKSEEARKESLAHRNKSCSLADQLKVLQERIKTRKAPAHPSASDAKRSETAILERRIKALEATNKVQAQQLKEAGIATPQRRIARGNSTAIPKSFVDLTRSSSPIGNDGLDSPATPLDGCMFATQASASSAQEGSSPTAQRKGKKRSRASLSVEPERLDDEMDEALFPMPGFGGRNPALPTRGNSVYVRFDSNESTHVTASRHATSSSTATNAASSLTSASSSVRPTVDCKSPSQTKKRKARVSAPSDSSSSSSSSSSNYNWLNSANGIALGPKRRSKAL